MSKVICPKGPTVKGVDISHHNGHVDFKRLKTWGCEFAFAKCTEATNYKDPMFHEHIEGAQRQGMLAGAYHFFHPKVDAIAQAKYFLDQVKYMNLSLPLVCDLEVTDNRRPSAVIEGAVHFLETIEHETGKTPIVYASPGFLVELPNLKSITRFPLWIANYGVKCPKVPESFKSGWTFWQNLGDVSGVIPGIKGQADGDLFNGSLEDLRKFAGLPTMSSLNFSNTTTGWVSSGSL